MIEDGDRELEEGRLPSSSSSQTGGLNVGLILSTSSQHNMTELHSMREMANSSTKGIRQLDFHPTGLKVHKLEENLVTVFS